MGRKSGVLLPISSLPGPFGIGTLGGEAREFAAFLAAAGQRVWQLLPICPTGFGDSPYQSFCTFAGNPYFIDPELLEQEGLLTAAEYRTISWGASPNQVDYGMLYRKRYPLLRQAARRLLKDPPGDYADFCRREADWLEDYALFMAIKDRQGGRPWWEWRSPLRNRDAAALEEARVRYREECLCRQAVQFLFWRQWGAFKQAVNAQGISLLGDLPIYAAMDSVEVWAHPELFQLDENKRPREVAGCPPDGFSDVGQLWGNPLFDWEAMARDGYTWWVDRIRRLLRVYDLLRIDHFRGFASYYAIPFGEKTARNGRWRKGPGMELFRRVNETLDHPSIIAEDLGFLTAEVRQLLADSGYPGMKVLEFAFDSRDPAGEEYLPQHYPVHCVAYTGTHDNDTIQGWLKTAPAADAARARETLGLLPGQEHWGMMEALWNSRAELTIVQAQDLLGLGRESRMNTPSTLGNNWRWRMLPGACSPALAERLHRYLEESHRL